MKNQILKFVFKMKKAKNAIIKEFTGTWADMEMYFPGAIIVNTTYVDELDLA